LGNKLGGGAFGTLGGLVAGAIGANVLSDKYVPISTPPSLA
jgi:hypothetical protein